MFIFFVFIIISRRRLFYVCNGQWLGYATLASFDRAQCRCGRIEQHLKKNHFILFYFSMYLIVYFFYLPLLCSLTIWITAIWSFISSRSLCFAHSRSLSVLYTHALASFSLSYGVCRVYAVLRPPLLWINVRASCSPCEWWWIAEFVCVVAVVLNRLFDRVEWEPKRRKRKYKYKHKQSIHEQSFYQFKCFKYTIRNILLGKSLQIKWNLKWTISY